jgi:hypothetical protein
LFVSRSLPSNASIRHNIVHVERSAVGLIQVIIPTELKKTMTEPHQNSLCPHRVLKKTSPKYKSETLPLEPNRSAFEMQTINSYAAGFCLVCVGNRQGVPMILIHTLCWFKLVIISAFEVATPSSIALALVNDHRMASLYPLV